MKAEDLEKYEKTALDTLAELCEADPETAERWFYERARAAEAILTHIRGGEVVKLDGAIPVRPMVRSEL